MSDSNSDPDSDSSSASMNLVIFVFFIHYLHLALITPLHSLTLAFMYFHHNQACYKI